MITVEPVPAFNDNYIWLIIQTENDLVAIVDPGDAAPVLKTLESKGLKPAAILITHHHQDHTGGVHNILQNFDVPVYGPLHEHIPGRTSGLTEGDTVDLEDMQIQFRILDMPGHTTGAVAYFGHGLLFVGDTLFMAGCGRLFEGTPAQMHSSLAKLAALPEDTLVYCAHEYTLANLKFAEAVEPDNSSIQKRIEECRSLQDAGVPTIPGSIAVEKMTNPFLRSHVHSVAAAASRYRQRKITDEIEVFSAIRNWKDNF